eukprot:jgi/Mesvir1/25704/Mv01897-RA.1
MLGHRYPMLGKGSAFNAASDGVRGIGGGTPGCDGEGGNRRHTRFYTSRAALSCELHPWRSPQQWRRQLTSFAMTSAVAGAKREVPQPVAPHAGGENGEAPRGRLCESQSGDLQSSLPKRARLEITKDAARPPHTWLEEEAGVVLLVNKRQGSPTDVLRVVLKMSYLGELIVTGRVMGALTANCFFMFWAGLWVCGSVCPLLRRLSVLLPPLMRLTLPRWTSDDVMAWLRARGLGGYKLNCVGGLAPIASGLMLVLGGPAVYDAQRYACLSYRYQGSFRLGEGTPSWDGIMPVAEHEPWSHVTDAALAAAAAKLVGELRNVSNPPKVVRSFKPWEPGSHPTWVAKHRPMSWAASTNRDMVVEGFRVRRSLWDPQCVYFSLVCTGATSVTSLVHDLARSVGSIAYLATLRREGIVTS